MAGIDNASHLRSKEDEERLARQKAKNPTNVSRARELAKQYSNPYKFSNKVTVTRTINDEKWYSGDRPTARETVARMFTVADGDEQRFNELQGMYAEEISNPGSVIYNPYAQATNIKAIDGLRELGVDVPDKITDQWVDSMWAQYGQYGRQTTTSYGPSAPTKTSTRENDIAYWVNTLMEDKENTNLAEAQVKGLYDEVKYYADRGYSDAEIMKRVRTDFNTKYNVLNNMDEKRILGDAVRLNRKVDYSGDDTIYGMIWAARNDGGTGDYFEDAVSYTLGQGNKYTFNADSEAARDPSNKGGYSPYSFGSTMDDLNIKYGQNEFTREWLEENRTMLQTEDGRKDWDRIEKAVTTQEEAMAELESLNGWMQRQIERGKGFDEISEDLTAMLTKGGEGYDSEYKTLANMEYYRERGSYVDMAGAVNFSLPAIIAQAEGMVQARDAALAAEVVAKEKEPNIITQIGQAVRSGWNWLMGEKGALNDVTEAQTVDTLTIEQMAQEYARNTFGVEITGELKPHEEKAFKEIIGKANAAALPGATKEQVDEANIAAGVLQDMFTAIIADPERVVSINEEAKAPETNAQDSIAWRSVFGSGQPAPREGMADMQLQVQSAVEGEELAYPDGSASRNSPEAAAYESMLLGGEWDSVAYTWALNNATNRAGVEAELVDGIRAIMRGEPGAKDKYPLANSWYKAHSSMIAHTGKVYGLLGSATLEDYDTRKAYGSRVFEAIEANDAAKKGNAISEEQYIDNLIAIGRVVDIVVGVTEGSSDDAVIEQVYEQYPVQADNLRAVVDSCDGAVAAVAQAEESHRQAISEAILGAFTAYNAGEVDEYQMAIVDAAFATDVTEVGKQDTAYQNMAAYLSENLSFDALMQRGMIFTTGSFDTDMMMDHATIQQSGAMAYAQGVGGIARAALERDMQAAYACGMGLEEYYKAFPQQAKTGDQLLAQAEAEYNSVWSGFGNSISAMLQANESLAERPEEGASVRPEDSLTVAQAAELGIAAFNESFDQNALKFLHTVLYGSRSTEEAINNLRVKYGNDAEALRADFTAYAESLPEGSDQRIELEGKLATYTDLFEIGMTVPQMKAEHAIEDKGANLQAIQGAVEQYGTKADKAVFDVAQNVATSTTDMAFAMMGQASGLSSFASQTLTALPQAGASAYDLKEETGNFSVAAAAGIAHAIVTGLTEAYMDFEYADSATRSRMLLAKKGATKMGQQNPGLLAELAERIMIKGTELTLDGASEGVQEMVQETLGILVDNTAKKAAGINTALFSGSDLKQVGQAGVMGFSMSPILGTMVKAGQGNYTGALDVPYIDTAGDILSAAEAMVQPDYDGHITNEAINSETDFLAVQDAAAELEALTASSEYAAADQTQADLVEAQQAEADAQAEYAAVEAEVGNAEQQLASLNDEMLSGSAFTEELGKQMVSVADALQKARERMQKIGDSLSEAQQRREAAQQWHEQAKKTVQQAYDQIMANARKRVRQVVIDRVFAGDSEAAKAAQEAYLSKVAELTAAKNELRSAKADVELYGRGTSRGQAAAGMLSKARRLVDELSDAVVQLRQEVEEAYAATPEALVEEAQASEAEMTAARAAEIAALDPENSQKQHFAEVTAAERDSEAAQNALLLMTEDAGKRLKSADSAVRKQAAADYQAAVQAASEADQAAKQARADYEKAYSAQGRLQAAIDNFKQYDNLDLIDENSENHEAAQKAYAALDLAMREADYDIAQRDVFKAASAMVADDGATIRAFKDARDAMQGLRQGNEMNAYNYAALASKEDMDITELPDASGMGRKEAIAAGRENVLQHSDRTDMNGAPAMFVRDLGKYVIVGRQSLSHGMDRRAGEQGAVVSRIGDILSNSIVVNEMIPKKEGVKNSYVLLGVARNTHGDLVYVRSVVNQSTMQLEDIASLYAVYGKTNRTSRALAADAWSSDRGIPSGSKISIAKLLEGVKSKFSDILSDDVLNTLGAQREESELSEGLKYRKAVQNQTNADDGWADHRGPAKTGEQTTADRNPIEILSDLTRSIRTGYNPGGSMSFEGVRVPRDVLAFYNERARSITSRTSEAGDLATGLHEFGHAVQARIPTLHATPQMIANLPQGARNAYDPLQLDGEAVAEFVVDYMYSRENAVNVYGDAYVQQFEDALRSDPALRRAIMNGRNQVELWNNADTSSKLGAMIKEGDDPRRGQIGNWIQRLARNIETAVADLTAPAELVSRDFRQHALYSMHASQRADTSLTRFMIDPQGRNIGQSLAERFYHAGVAEGDQAEVSRYALARHALDRLAQRKPVFDEHEFPENELRMYIADVEANHPNIVAGADALTSFWSDYMDAWWVDTGMIDRDDVARMRRMYPHYVPTFRVVGKNFNQYGGSSRFQMRRAVDGGSSLEVIDPIASIVRMTQQMTSTVTQNQLMRAFHAEMQQGGLGDIAERVTQQMMVQRNDTDALQASLDAINATGTVDPALMGDAYAEMLNLQERWYGTGQNYDANVVSGVDENGNRFFYRIKDEGLYNLLSGNANRGGDMGAILRGIRNFKNAFTKLTTGSNPLFAVKNAQRDIQASVNTGTHSLTYVDGMVRWLRAFHEVVTGSETFRDWQAMGGGEHTRFNTELNGSEAGTVVRDLGRSLMRGRVTRRGEFRTRSTALENIANVFTWEKFNNAIENASRYVEYRFGRHDLSTDEGRREAFMTSQDVTTNFGTHGANRLVRLANQVVPFMNATIQGLNKDYNILKDLFSDDVNVRRQAAPKAAKTAMNTALTAMLQYAMLQAFGGKEDDEDYALLSQEMRLGNLIIPVSKDAMNLLGESIGFDKPYIRIPIAQGPMARGLYAAALDMVSNMADYSPMEVELWEAAKSILSDSMPDGTVFQAISDAKNNRTWYGGEIESEYMRSHSETNRYDSDTPAMVVELGRRLNVSPAKLDYLLNQYSGFAGKIIMPLISADRFDGEYSLPNSAKNLAYSILKNYTIDPVSSNDLSTSYTAAKDTISQIIADGKAGKPMGNLAYSADAEDAYEAAERLSKEFSAIDKEIKAHWADYNDIKDSALSDGEKANQMRSIRRDYIIPLQQEAMALYEEYKMEYIDADPLAMEIAGLFYWGLERPAM